ncbi:hypothetical protein BSKO_12980 [Bryopsis sp. KO-2023]|nr:hypothetical protein BSKO_12980 [Bryopsis sp. KO-2023]
MATSDSDVVVFDVGGQRFSTTVKTLNRYPDSLLPAMCKECHNAVGTGKEIHIDRTPEGFGWILEIYRDSKRQNLPSNWSMDDLQRELDFYQLPLTTDSIPFHADMLVIVEKDALKKLAKEICEQMKRVQGEIFFLRSAKFLLWAEIDDSTNSDPATKLRCEFIKLSIVSDQERLKKFIGSFWKPGHRAFNIGQVALLSKPMLDLGLKVSLEVFECAVRYRSEKVSPSIVEVTWDY